MNEQITIVNLIDGKEEILAKDKVKEKLKDCIFWTREGDHCHEGSDEFKGPWKVLYCRNNLYYNQANRIHVEHGHEPMSLQEKHWGIALRTLRPEYEHFLELDTIDIVFMYSIRDYWKKKSEKVEKKVASKVIVQDGNHLLVMALVPGVYGFGYGCTLPYHFYWLKENGGVFPVDYNAQNLSVPLGNTIPENSDISISEWRYG